MKNKNKTSILLTKTTSVKIITAKDGHCFIYNFRDTKGKTFQEIEPARYMRILARIKTFI